MQQESTLTFRNPQDEDEKMLQSAFSALQHTHEVRECPSEDNAGADRLELAILGRLIQPFDVQYLRDQIRAEDRK
jgi:hypothetical protein